MEKTDESFVFKEFLVGLVVVLFLLFIGLSLLGKLTQNPKIRRFFTRETKKTVVQKDYCSSYPFIKNINPEQTLEFERIVKRSGWPEKKYRYLKEFSVGSSEELGFQISSQEAAVLPEKNGWLCKDDNLFLLENDPLLISALLDVFPEKMSGFAQIPDKIGQLLLLPSGDLSENQSWENNLGFKGALLPANYLGDPENRYCFSLAAKGISFNKGSEKIPLLGKETEVFKVESTWEATISANLAEMKKSGECQNFSGDFNEKASVKVKDEVWYLPGLGLVKRRIAPLDLSGQVYLLPNGYLPLEITDELVEIK